MSMREAANLSKAWVFEEARKVVARAEKLDHNEVVFETGYGPSGLPHIGTFGEVVRTTMVRQAFHLLAPEKKSRLICFPMTWMACAKCPTIFPMAIYWLSISKSR